MDEKKNQQKLVSLYERILVGLGLDINSEGLRRTAERHIKFLNEALVPDKFELTCFTESTNEMVTQNGIFVSSLCEHHMLPFFGTASIGYVPNGKVCGLSKLVRAVRYFARSANNQERLTQQIGRFLHESRLSPRGVGVSIRCLHTCMAIRGVREQQAITTTRFLAGVIKDDPKSRSEFLDSVEHPQHLV